MNVNKHLKIIIILCLPLFILILVSLVFPGAFRLGNARFYDIFFKLRFLITGTEKIAPEFRFFNITDSFLEKYENSGNTRAVYAQILEGLHKAGAKTIIWDSFFTQRGSKPDDSRFIKATAACGNVYFPFYINRKQTINATAADLPLQEKYLFIPASINNQGDPILVSLENIRYPFPELALAAAGLGFINKDSDADGITRRIPLFYSSSRGYLVPSLVMAGICNFYGVEPATIQITYGKYIKLPGAQYHGRTKDVFIPVDKKGQLIINFPGPVQNSLHHIPLERVAQHIEGSGSNLSLALAGTLVFTGDISTSGKDYSMGIFDKIYPNSFLLGSAINTILSGQYLYEANYVESGILYLLVSVLVFLFRRFMHNRNNRFFLSSFLLFFTFITLLIPGIGLVSFITLSRMIHLQELLLGIAGIACGLAAVRLIESNSLVDAESDPEKPVTCTPLLLNGEFDPELALRRLGVVTRIQLDTTLLLLEGLEQKAMAEKLCISLAAVKRRLFKIYRKCKVKNRMELFKKVYGIQVAQEDKKMKG